MKSKQAFRAGLYPPPNDGLPFIAVAITGEGRQYLESFFTKREAKRFLDKIRGDNTSRFSRAMDTLPVTEP